MEKVLNSITNGYGDKVSTAVLFEEGGVIRLWEVACYSSQALGLGNCQCINHPMATETPLSTAECVRRFGEDALDGFGKPGYHQKVFDTFGVEAHELETFLRIAYYFNTNPLPALRRFSEQPIVFGEDPDMLTFPEEEPGTTIFVVNGRGEISVVTVEGRQEAANIPLENIPAGIGRKK